MKNMKNNKIMNPKDIKNNPIFEYSALFYKLLDNLTEKFNSKKLTLFFQNILFDFDRNTSSCSSYKYETDSKFTIIQKPDQSENKIMESNNEKITNKSSIFTVFSIRQKPENRYLVRSLKLLLLSKSKHQNRLSKLPSSSSIYRKFTKQEKWCFYSAFSSERNIQLRSLFRNSSILNLKRQVLRGDSRNRKRVRSSTKVRKRYSPMKSRFVENQNYRKRLAIPVNLSLNFKIMEKKDQEFKSFKR